MSPCLWTRAEAASDVIKEQQMMSASSSSTGHSREQRKEGGGGGDGPEDVGLVCLAAGLSVAVLLLLLVSFLSVRHKRQDSCV